MLMETYDSAAAGLYLIPKSWRCKPEGRGVPPEEEAKQLEDDPWKNLGAVAA